MILGRDDIIAALESGNIYHSGFPSKKADREKFYEEYVQPASMDIPLGEFIAAIPSPPRMISGAVSFLPASTLPPIHTDGEASEYFITRSLKEFGPKGFPLPPNAMVLGHSEHFIGLAPGFAAQVATRSTARRWGIDVCAAAGWIDPGYCSRITLEVMNTWGRDLFLREGVCYAQLVFAQVSGNEKAYEGHYNVSEEDWTPHSMLPKPL